MELKLFEGERNFMEIIWQNEPVPSGELVKLCNEAFGWKKSTTYTMLKKMAEKGFAENQESIVTSLVTKEQSVKYASTQFMEREFRGSLPDFMVAFLGSKKISQKEAEELKRLIDGYTEK